jgi:hypothetical protein
LGARSGAAALAATADAASALRAAGVEELARALVPRDPAVRPTQEATAAADAALPDLAALLDYGMGDGGGAAPAGDTPAGTPPDAAARGAALLRLSAATAILRLARSPLDARVPAGAYLGMALTVQDPEIDVRSGFTDALAASLGRLARSPGAGARAAKLAAPLALAAVDPSAPARARAARALASFVATRRKAAASAARGRALKAAAEAGGRGQGGAPATAAVCTALIHEGPEFLLPYLAQILAHHPDLPPLPPLPAGVAGLDAAGRAGLPPPGTLAPFSTMLQFALETLLLSAPAAPGAPPGAPLHAASKILRAVRAAEDGTPEPAGGALAVLADMGLALARALVVVAPPRGAPAPAPRAAGGGGASSLAPLGGPDAGDRIPGGVPLPRSLYAAPDPPRPRLADGACLVPGWAPALVAGLVPPAAGGGGGGPAAGGAAPKRARGAPKAAAAGAPKPKKVRAAAAAAPPKPKPALKKKKKKKALALESSSSDEEGETSEAAMEEEGGEEGGSGTPSDEVIRAPAARRPPVEAMAIDGAGRAAKQRAGSLAASSSSSDEEAGEEENARARGGRRAAAAAGKAAAAPPPARPGRAMRARQ